MDAQRASADLSEFMGIAWRLQWNKQVRLGVRVGPAGLEKARKRFHDQDERFNDSNRGVTVKTTWEIGPIPYSTAPLQLSNAFWSWSGGVGTRVGTPWKVIPLRVLPSKEGRGVGQTWLLSAKRPPPALELTLPSGKVFIRAEMTGPRRARTGRAQKKQHSDARGIEVGRPWKAVTLLRLLCVAGWETCQCRHGSMMPERSLCQTNSSVHSEHLCKSVNPHRHSATDTSARKHSNTIKTAEHGNPRSKQVTLMVINTTSLRRHWPALAREEDITHWACTEARMLE